MKGLESGAIEKIVCFEGLNYFRIKRKDKETQVDAKIVSIGCGFNYSYCVSNEGRLFVWGSNSGQSLGVEPAGSITVPTEVPEFRCLNFVGKLREMFPQFLVLSLFLFYKK